MASGYALFDPTEGNGNIQTPDHASLDIVGDIDIRALLAPDNWLANQAVITKRDGADYSFRFRLESGQLFFHWWDSGLADSAMFESTVPVPGTDGNPLWVRVTLDADNGADQGVGRFYVSTDPIETVPSSVVWVQLGAEEVEDDVAAIAVSTAPVSMGDDDGINRLAGRFYYAEIRDGIGGTVVADPDFRTTAQKTGDSPSTFTDTTGKVWTFDGPVWVPPSGGGRRKIRGPRNPRRYQV